jgi:uncharacterized protein YsxB (DUF464 family)
MLEGHAGYAEQGEDIVCASASILAYTLASIVETFGVETNINLEAGDTTIECECTDHPMMDVIMDSYNFAMVGFSLLQQSYPQYVSLLDFT